MSPASITTIPERALGVVRLDRRVIQEIDAAQDAIYQAVVVVALVGVANGVAIASTEGSGAYGLLLAIFGNFVAWFCFAGLALAIGTGIMPDEGTEAETTNAGVFQTLGFAMTPNLLGIAGIIGLAGQILAFAGLVWMFVCAVVSISVALRMGVGRSIVIAVVAGIATVIVLNVIGAIAGEPIV